MKTYLCCFKVCTLKSIYPKANDDSAKQIFGDLLRHPIKQITTKFIYRANELSRSEGQVSGARRKKFFESKLLARNQPFEPKAQRDVIMQMMSAEVVFIETLFTLRILQTGYFEIKSSL